MRRQGPPGPQGPRAFNGAGFGVTGFAPRFLLGRRERLALTDDQAKQLEALATETEQARDKAMAGAKTHREKMRDLWAAERIDVSALQAEARAAMQTEQAAHLQALTNVAKAKALLTAEQRGRVEGWADARRWGMRRFGRGQGPAGPMGRGPRPGNGPRGPMRRF
jgi:Spy/CpxP family protein refolding chaperone